MIKKIIAKKEFSDLPKGDVERIYENFEKRQTSDEDKIKLTRDLLRKVYSVFSSGKLFNKKVIDKKSPDEILKKHISTRERYDFYSIIYGKVFDRFEQREISVIDLGAGVNAFSNMFFPANKDVNYTGVEAVGQLVDLSNYFFKKYKIKNAKMIHESLYETEKIKQIILGEKKPKIIFLFKVLDGLEMAEKNYSKKFLKEVAPLVNLVVVSFATRSLISGKKFNVKRYWFENFVNENFDVLDDFEVGGERYIFFRKR